MRTTSLPKARLENLCSSGVCPHQLPNHGEAKLNKPKPTMQQNSNMENILFCSLDDDLRVAVSSAAVVVSDTSSLYLFTETSMLGN
eukprot:9942-Amphidinium_carterae.1